MSFFNLLKSKPFGTLKGYNQEVCRSQKHIVSPPKMTSPEKIQKKKSIRKIVHLTVN
jgi:hypothetical protein